MSLRSIGSIETRRYNEVVMVGITSVPGTDLWLLLLEDGIT